MIAHSHAESHRVGDIHKVFTHPLCIRKHFNVSVLAGPLKCYPSNQINFLVFIALLLLAYIKELIISVHFLWQCCVPLWGWRRDECRKFACFSMFCHAHSLLLYPPPTCPSSAWHACVSVCVFDICETHYCQIASPVAVQSPQTLT